MYEVNVGGGSISRDPAHGTDIEDAVSELRDALIKTVQPRMRVSWVVRCPSGRVVHGDITINAGGDTTDAIADHVDYIRDVLIADTISDSDQFSDDREG